MKKLLKSKDYLLLLLVLFILQIFILIKNLISGQYMDYLWFCDFAPILIILAFVVKEDQLVKAIINIGFLTQFYVLICLIFGLFSIETGVFEVADSLSYGKFYTITELLIHIIPINIIFFLTYEKETNRKSLIYSAIIITLMFIVSRIFTLPYRNVNLSYNIFGISFPIYIYFPLWFILTFGLIILPTYYFQNYIRNKKINSLNSDDK